MLSVFNQYREPKPETVTESDQPEQQDQDPYVPGDTEESPTEELTADTDTDTVDATEGPVANRASPGYVEFHGKTYQQDAFQSLYPNVNIQADNDTIDADTAAGFGTKFPDTANKGDIFLRVDYLPTKLFKFNGTKWIEVDKNLTDRYTYNDAYIDHLVEKIASGEYDPELLSDAEREQLESRLKQDLTPGAQ
jgi:hypothetical protein